MLLAAELRTLPAEDARRFRLEPAIAHETGDRILLDAERRHRPRVNDVVRSDQDAYLLADRDDERIVDLEQVVFTLRLLPVDLLPGRREIAVEAEAVIEIVVAPLPLVPGDLDRHVGPARVLHRQNRLCRREGHEEQDKKRNDRP